MHNMRASERLQERQKTRNNKKGITIDRGEEKMIN